MLILFYVVISYDVMVVLKMFFDVVVRVLDCVMISCLLGMCLEGWVEMEDDIDGEVFVKWFFLCVF